MSDFENTHDFINKLKEEGNLLFKRNEYDKSLEVYEKALNMFVQNSDKSISSLKENEEYNQLQDKKDYYLENCETASLSALSFAKNHIKALICLISVLLIQGKAKEGLDRLVEFKKNNMNLDESSIKILNELKYKCNSLLILRNGIPKSNDPETIRAAILSSGADISEKTANILSRLNMRRFNERSKN